MRSSSDRFEIGLVIGLVIRFKISLEIRFEIGRSDLGLNLQDDRNLLGVTVA